MGWKLVSTEVGTGVHRYTNPAAAAALAEVLLSEKLTPTRVLLERLGPHGVRVDLVVGAPNPEYVDVRDLRAEVSRIVGEVSVRVLHGGLYFYDAATKDYAYVVNMAISLFLAVPGESSERECDADAQLGV